MNIDNILSSEYTLCCAPSGSKKRVLEHLSHFIADRIESMDADALYQQFLARERLGSTGIGDGVAIPHCRVSGCHQITGALLRLETPVDFDAIDDQPVDIVFALIVPEEQNDEHLKTLSAIAQMLQEGDNLAKLRSAKSNTALYQTAIARPPSTNQQQQTIRESS